MRVGSFHKGNIFTLFLSDPLSAFCVLVGVENIKQQVLEEGFHCLQSTLEAICKLVFSTPSIGMQYHYYVWNYGEWSLAR